MSLLAVLIVLALLSSSEAGEGPRAPGKSERLEGEADLSRRRLRRRRDGIPSSEPLARWYSLGRNFPEKLDEKPGRN